MVSSLSIFIWFFALWLILNSTGSDWCGRRPGSPGIFYYYVFTIAACLLISWFTGPRFDYVDYVKQWTESFANGVFAPWKNVPSNAYGPVHMIFSPLALLNPLLPKMISAFLLISTSLYITLKSVDGPNDFSRDQKFLLFLYTLASPFAIISFWIYGINDTISVFFMVLAIFALQPRVFSSTLSTGLSALSLSIAVLHKFYPIVLLPFIVYRNRKIDFLYIFFFTLGFSLILIISYCIWGLDMLRPVLFASARSAQHLSIFNALSSIKVNITSISPIAMFAATSVVLIIYNRSRLGFVNASFLGFVVFVFFYKVGHTPYYTFAMLMSPYLFRSWKAELAVKDYKKLTAAYIFWLGFINLYSLEYVITCQMTVDTSARVFRYFGGFPFALITIYLVVTGIRCLSSPPNSYKVN